MPGHFIVLRHQQGDDWDYCVIEHLGPKATVDPAGTPPNPGTDLRAWHTDTFVSGPPWAEFAKSMGVEGTGAGTGWAVDRDDRPTMPVVVQDLVGQRLELVLLRRCQSSHTAIVF